LEREPAGGEGNGERNVEEAARLRKLHQEWKSRQGVKPSALPSLAHNDLLRSHPLIKSSNNPVPKGRGFAMRECR
jgi:hypothetical protein